jgi:hypothetical protein
LSFNIEIPPLKEQALEDPGLEQPTTTARTLQTVFLKPCYLGSNGISAFSEGPKFWAIAQGQICPPQTQMVWLNLTGPLNQGFT